MRQAMALMCAAILGLAAAAPAAAAEEPPPFRDFTFKRMKAPPPGSSVRITVQIDPLAPEAKIIARPDLDRPEPGTWKGVGPEVGDSFAWYWTAVSPARTAGGPGRFAEAVAALDHAPAGEGVNAPRLQTVKGIADAYGAEILKATVGTKVSPALVLAVIAVESGGNAAAKSGAGASGLMQLMPDTATRFSVKDSTDPVQNIRGGVAYLDWLMGRFGQDAVLALAGYNAGEGAVDDAGGVPNYTETRGYVPKVLAAWRVARGLCRTPPDLPGDGCVFVQNVVPANG